MSETATIPWRTNYAACFKPLAAKQEDAIEAFLQANITGLTVEELDRAVANLCETWDVSFLKRVPNVNDIKIRILTLRKRRGENTAARYGYKIGEFEQGLRNRIAECTDPYERFNIVCEAADHASDCDMCQRLERYAKTLPGGVKRPTMASMREIMAPVVKELTKVAREDRKRMEAL